MGPLESSGAVPLRELHPLTISSAPHDAYPSFRIQACGPWKRALRDMTIEMQGKRAPSLRTVRIDDPCGEGHQD
ncbi:Dual oxidase 1 [Porphyridium purpureum]|uniref:Dual oxidase 1 n=1 Tax=Porphyridium purpureum TaxID=35688 RepID=A0A5J4YFV3_PORPP|nr:Dual oxidase 1 [Porphyridium purpureum]|eukprot:POR1256..scf276_29